MAFQRAARGSVTQQITDPYQLAVELGTLKNQIQTGFDRPEDQKYVMERFANLGGDAKLAEVFQTNPGLEAAIREKSRAAGWNGLGDFWQGVAILGGVMGAGAASGMGGSTAAGGASGAAGGGLTAEQAASTSALSGEAGATALPASGMVGTGSTTAGESTMMGAGGAGTTGSTVAASTAPAATAATPTVGSQLFNAGVGALINYGGAQLAGKPDKTPMATANTAAEIYKDQYDFYRKNYQPLEREFIDQTRQAGSPEEYAAAAGRATADVTGAYDQANKATESRLQSYGINPSSPAYQSRVGSLGLSEGASRAGALTEAYNKTRDTAYSKMKGAVETAKGIPSQSASGLTSAANTQMNAITGQTAQNTANMTSAGGALQPFVAPLQGAASNWYSTSSFAKGGKVEKRPKPFDGKHGLEMMTPHMKPMMKYAEGGEIENEEEEASPSEENEILEGPGTETSDSIPAEIDGKKPAALSTGEFVMVAPVMKMSGEEIMQAINKAGLEKRNYANGGPVEAPVGSGLARRGIETTSARKKYQEEQMQAAEEGRTLPPFDQWVSQGYKMGGKVGKVMVVC